MFMFVYKIGITAKKMVIFIVTVYKLQISNVEKHFIVFVISILKIQ